MKFVVGTLQLNEPGAQYQGNTFDRRLIVKHVSGFGLNVFDGFDQISEDLPVEQVYEFVLCPLTAGLSYIEQEQLQISENGWTGQVIDTNWKFSDGDCRLAVPKLIERNWVVVSTLVGNMIFPDRKKKEIVAGQYASWKPLRIDLFGVV